MVYGTSAVAAEILRESALLGRHANQLALSSACSRHATLHRALIPPVAPRTVWKRALSAQNKDAGTQSTVEDAASIARQQETSPGVSPIPVPAESGSTSMESTRTIPTPEVFAKARARAFMRGNTQIRERASRLRKAIRLEKRLRDASSEEQTSLPGDYNRKAMNRLRRNKANMLKRIEDATAATAVLAKYKIPVEEKSMLSNVDLLNSVDDISEKEGLDIVAAAPAPQELEFQRPRAGVLAKPVTHRRLTFNALGHIKDGLPAAETRPQQVGALKMQGSFDLQELSLSPKQHPRLINMRKKLLSKGDRLAPQEMNEFQLQLQKNPYARMLAGPIRACMLTGVRLPTHFLQSFNVKLDSDGGDLWVVPSSFRPDWHQERHYVEALGEERNPLSLVSATPFIDRQAVRDSEAEMNSEGIATSADLQMQQFYVVDDELDKRALDPSIEAEPAQRNNFEDAKDAEAGEEPAGTVRWPTTAVDGDATAAVDGGVAEPGQRRIDVMDGQSSGYVLATMPALQYAGKMGQRFARAATPRWRLGLGPLTKDLRFRSDAAELVRTLLRRKAARHLAWLEHTRRRCVVPWKASLAGPRGPNASAPASDVGVSQAAAILWFGEGYDSNDDTVGVQSPDAVGGDIAAAAAAAAAAPPLAGHGLAAMLRSGTSERGETKGVPVLDMRRLLGRTEYDWLRGLAWRDERGEHASVYVHAAVVVKNKAYAMKALMLLWRLHGYGGSADLDAVEAPSSSSSSPSSRNAGRRAG